MKYNLVGQSYTARSLAAAAQTCVNVYPERLEDTEEKAKGGAVLVGCPQKHLFKDLTVIDAGATPFRGALMVTGRLFVVAGSKFFEIDSTGALVGSIFTVTYDAANPTATLYTNGGAQQIMIVSANLVHMYDGFSMNIINLPLFTGNVRTDGKTVYWMSGDKFDPGMTATSITIAGRNFTVAVVNSPEVLTLTTTVSLTVTAGTNANPVKVTTSINHALLTGAQVFGQGFISGFAPLNSESTSPATYFTITVTAANQFEIVGKDSTAWGAFPGNGTFDPYDTVYQCTVGAMRAVSGAQIDGYFIAARLGGTKWNISPLNDGGNNGLWVWDQLDFANFESTPGNFRQVVACNEQLFLFTSTGFEAWQNTGQGVGGFPFERINGATSNLGGISRWGGIDLGGRVGYIGMHEGGIAAFILDGFTPRRVSTFAEESAWNFSSLGKDCISYTYTEDGHTFWVINFGPQTWAYDLTVGANIFSGFWHQRYAYVGGVLTAYGIKYHVFAKNELGYLANDWGAIGKHLVGGDGTGKIYEMSVNVYDDVGTDWKWQRVLPYQYDGGKRIYFGRQTLIAETGAVPSGAAPVVTREYSDDRGQTWLNPQTASLGVHNDTGLRVYWPIGGSSYERLWRYSGIGQNKVALVCIDSEQETGTV